jgi:hypothetical protein
MRCGGVFAVSWTRRANALAALVDLADRGCDASNSPPPIIWTTIETYMAEHAAVLPDDKEYDLPFIAREAVAAVYADIREPPTAVT